MKKTNKSDPIMTSVANIETKVEQEYINVSMLFMTSKDIFRVIDERITSTVFSNR